MKQGKCANYAGCLLAYRNETITISEGEFVCPECKQPLMPIAEAGRSSPKLIPTLIVGGIVVLVLMSAAAVWTQAKRMQQKPVTTREQALAAEMALQNQGTLMPPRKQASSPPPEEAAPLPVTATSAPNLDLENKENQQVKAEVLKRIDLM